MMNQWNTIGKQISTDINRYQQISTDINRYSIYSKPVDVFYRRSFWAWHTRAGPLKLLRTCGAPKKRWPRKKSHWTPNMMEIKSSISWWIIFGFSEIGEWILKLVKHFAKLERFGELFFVQPEYRCQVAKPLIKIYRINKIYNSRVKKTDCRILWQFIASSTVKAPEFGRYHVPLTHSRREFTHVSHGRRLIPFAALLIAARTAQWPNMVKFPSKNMQSVKIVGKYVDITTSHYFSLYGYVFFFVVGQK